MKHVNNYLPGLKDECEVECGGEIELVILEILAKLS